METISYQFKQLMQLWFSKYLFLMSVKMYKHCVIVIDRICGGCDFFCHLTSWKKNSLGIFFLLDKKQLLWINKIRTKNFLQQQKNTLVNCRKLPWSRTTQPRYQKFLVGKIFSWKLVKVHISKLRKSWRHIINFLTKYWNPSPYFSNLDYSH